MFLTSIQDISGSNLGQGTDYPRSVRCFPPVNPENSGTGHYSSYGRFRACAQILYSLIIISVAYIGDIESVVNEQRNQSLMQN
jgi:hypothetical protein